MVVGHQRQGSVAFMRGDEDYKYKFGGVRRDVMQMRVGR